MADLHDLVGPAAGRRTGSRTDQVVPIVSPRSVDSRDAWR